MATSERSGAVRTWLYGVAALVVLMVAVGGATRLTGSGLSITEWRPVTGIVPPLSQADWAMEFAKYRDTPQYAILNQGMGLSAFKVLYGWEWGHPPARTAPSASSSSCRSSRSGGADASAAASGSACWRWGSSVASRVRSAGSWSPRAWSRA